MAIRTDLALESRELCANEEIDGVKSTEYQSDNIKITRIEITNENGAQKLSKEIGNYITAEVPPFSRDAELFDGRLDVISKELEELLPKEGLILVVGLGNDSITPDALGPKSIDNILPTRHISGELAQSIGLGDLRPVAGIAPGVLGQTGIETGEVIKGIVDKVNPAAVIVIDALASRRLSRLGCTIQMSDTGISPGAGIGNFRAKIDKDTIGVDVISIGVPTVVDGATLVQDLLSDNGIDISEKNAISPEGETMIVTPKEIDLLIEHAARLVGMSINCALQKSIDAKDILSLLS